MVLHEHSFQVGSQLTVTETIFTRTRYLPRETSLTVLEVAETGLILKIATVPEAFPHIGTNRIVLENEKVSWTRSEISSYISSMQLTCERERE